LGTGIAWAAAREGYFMDSIKGLKPLDLGEEIHHSGRGKSRAGFGGGGILLRFEVYRWKS